MEPTSESSCRRPTTRRAGGFDGAWALSGKWTGYMGLALRIRGDHYKYWFSSDAAEPTFSSQITMPDGRVERHTYIPKRLSIHSPGARLSMATRLSCAGPATTTTASGDASFIAVFRAYSHKSIIASGRRADDLPMTVCCFGFHDLMRSTRKLNYGGHKHADGSVSATSPFAHK